MIGTIGVKMITSFERLAAEALKMSAVDRAAFAQLLLESLHPDEGHSEAWEREIQRRLSEIVNGKVKLVPIEEALAQLRSTLK